MSKNYKEKITEWENQVASLMEKTRESNPEISSELCDIANNMYWFNNHVEGVEIENPF